MSAWAWCGVAGRIERCSAEELGAKAAEEFFEKQVHPVLAAKCLECHGDEDPEGGLRLTSLAHVLKGGQSGPAAIAKNPEGSLLIKAVSHTAKRKMPPDARLREDEIAALRKWVELGLPWPGAEQTPRTIRNAGGEMVVTDADRQHWAFRPIANPPLAAVRGGAWVKTTLDHFVLAKLEAAGLAPAERADRRTLIRRVYYDLIGLPPSWQETQAFVNDPSPHAYAAMVERLLASPRYGERWGRHWLDVARYADTKDGVLMYGEDRIRPYAYTYRDYVIRAFNADVRFDQFIIDQLAADLIEPKVEPWRLAALGFLTLGRLYDNNIHDIIDDQIDTVSRGFLGLTVACARCHDHKYDPIPTADYYSLYGVFASSEVPLELPAIVPPEQVAGGVDFEKLAGPKREELRKFVDEQYALLTDTARLRIGDYLMRIATTPPNPLESAIFFLSLTPEDLRPPVVARWRRYLEQRATPDDPVFGLWHDLMQLPSGGGLEWAASAAAIVDRWKLRTDGTQAGQFNPLIRAAFVNALPKTRADVAAAYGSVLKRVYEESKATAAAGTASPPPDAAARRQLLDVLVSRDSPAYFPKSQTRRHMSRVQTDMCGAKMQELDRMAVKSPSAPPRAMVVFDAQVPVDPCIFVRGNATQRGKPVPRQSPAILSPGPRKPFVHGSGRLELARAIVSPDNPLTTRVIVNRIWMHHFGEPLVSTPSDFGTRSTPPDNPELLDHLASWFVHEGWSIKNLHRLIMLSSTYQQSSAPSAEAAQRGRSVDPENRRLWRMNRRRLDFESMRDTLLAVAGRLTERNGGRPIDAATDPHNADRSIYGWVDRQNVPGVFRAFDFATPDQSVERRPRTMVPQQALFLLNSPFALVQSRAVAARPEVAGAAPPAQRIAALYRAVLAREPTAEETAACLAFVAAPIDGKSTLTAWEQLAQVLLGSNELMYVD